MQISDFLAPANVLLDIRADKDRLLRDLSQRAASELRLDAMLVSEEIARRERLGSTAMGEGIAIPHARIEGLERPFGILVRLAKPMEFAAIDERPVDLVFFLLLPAKARGEQLTALASVARKLRDATVAARLRACADGGDAYRTITG